MAAAVTTSCSWHEVNAPLPSPSHVTIFFDDYLFAFIFYFLHFYRVGLEILHILHPKVKYFMYLFLPFIAKG